MEETIQNIDLSYKSQGRRNVSCYEHVSHKHQEMSHTPKGDLGVNIIV